MIGKCSLNKSILYMYKKGMTDFVVFLSCIVVLSVTAACGDKRTYAEINRIDSIAVKSPQVAVGMADSMMRADSAEMSTREQMKLRLVRGRARNSAGIPLGSEQEIRAVAEYFEKHGTDNERMSAYYVLGSVCEQCGENMPMDALKFYDMAIGFADTMSAECDYRTLALAYAAKADILEDNYLLDNGLDAWKTACKYSLRANDKFLYISLLSCMSDTYYLKGDTDMAIRIGKRAYSLFEKNGYKDNARRLLGIVSFCYWEADSVDSAIELTRKYLGCPLLFDKDGELKKGCNIYHYVKGRLYLEENKADSAKLAFEALLNEGSKNFKQASFKGMYFLYKRKCMMDSTVKYAELWNAYADSSYREAATSQLNKMQYAYGYSQKEKDILEVKSDLYANTFKVLFLCCFIVILAMLSYIIIRSKNVKIKMADERINILKSLIEDKEMKLKNLMKKVANNEVGMEMYKEKIKFLKEEIGGLRDEILIHQGTNENSDNAQNDILSQIKAKAKKGIALSIKERNCFAAYARMHNPNFVNLISDKDNITEKEFLVCSFVMYDFAPSEIVCMLDISSQILSNMRSRLNMKIFKIEGGAKDFDRNLKKYVRTGCIV